MSINIKKNQNQLSFVDFSQRFRLIRKYKDPYNRDYQICKDMKTQKRAIVKSYVIQSKQQEQAILQNLSNYVQLREIDSLAKFISYTKIQNKQIQAGFQFHDMTIQEFTKTKALDNKEKCYDVCTILLNQMIILLAIMQQIGMEIDDIRKNNILVEVIDDKKYQFKLFYDQRERGQMKSFFGVYISPQRLQQMQKFQQDIDSPPLYQAEPKLVYQLALLVLDIATEQVKQSYYNVQNRINNKTIQRKMNVLGKKFQKKYLSNILYEMLKPLNQRLTINDIKTKNQSEFGKSRTFSANNNKSNTVESVSDSNDNINIKKQFQQDNSNIVPNIQSQNNFFFSNLTSNINQNPSIPQKINIENPNNLMTNTISSGGSQSFLQKQHQAHPQVLKSLQKMRQNLKNVKTQTKKYPDGSTYYGQMTQNSTKKEGLGIYSYNHGDIYFGEWRDNNLINGTYIFKNGQSYEGTVKNGKQGYGKYRYANGNTYVGGWQNDLKHGKGEMKYPNGDRYEGSWMKGKKNGHGIYYYSNGLVYEGNFIDGKKNGHGTLTYLDSSIFQGNWQQYYAEGFGKIFYDNGDLFQGNFHQSFKVGKGVYKWKEGRVYQGEFKEDQMVGFCKINYENGNYYEGNINMGLKNGQGTYVYSNKDIFKGIWKNDLKQMGSYRFHDGNQFEGEFRDNEIFYGVMKYANGDIYQGQFKNNQRNGYGKYIFVDKSILSGEWKNDHFIRIT